MKIIAIAAACAACTITGAVAQTASPDARIVRAGTVARQPAPAGNFTGPVWLSMLTSAKAPERKSTALVSFPVGSRSNWHSHPLGQTLYVTEGCGWTQSAGGPVQRICAGDTVYSPPGAKHWHGATATTEMSHLAISEGINGHVVDWLEPVTAAQYQGPRR